MQVNTNSNTTAQNDSAFMALLSSQRELLNQLNKENALRRAGALNNTSPRRNDDLLFGTRGSMFDRRSSIDMLVCPFPKRLSMGIGNDSCLLPELPFDFGDSSHRCDYSSKDALPEKKPKFEAFDSPIKPKKRRLSSLGFLSSSFFEDYLQTSTRRDSLLSVSKLELRGLDASERSAIIPTGIDFGDEDETESLEPLELEPHIKNSKIDPEVAKQRIESFQTAMDESQKSQQSIHDWDRKMGLKRSHSKTMRLSSRSRKKLRSMLKNELNALVSQG